MARMTVLPQKQMIELGRALSVCSKDVTSPGMPNFHSNLLGTPQFSDRIAINQTRN